MLNDSRFKDYFLFTQQSLATFDHCPLKFKKRYLENLKWNSFPDESVKRRLERGNDFHLIACRYFMGIDTGLNEFAEEFAELNEWEKSLKFSFEKRPDALYLPEYKLRMAAGELKLEANFDLLVVREDSVEIWDWKTRSQGENKKAIDGKRLKESLQTMVYMFVLKEQSLLICGKEVECERFSMHYWQPEPAGIITELQYSNSLHQRYRETLSQKIRNITEYDYSGFDKEDYKKHCKYCEFNWFCNNERVDFKAMEEEDDLLDALEWDSIEERF